MGPLFVRTQPKITKYLLLNILVNMVYYLVLTIFKKHFFMNIYLH